MICKDAEGTCWLKHSVLVLSGLDLPFLAVGMYFLISGRLTFVREWLMCWAGRMPLLSSQACRIRSQRDILPLSFSLSEQGFSKGKKGSGRQEKGLGDLQNHSPEGVWLERHLGWQRWVTMCINLFEKSSQPTDEKVNNTANKWLYQAGTGRGYDPLNMIQTNRFHLERSRQG